MNCALHPKFKSSGYEVDYDADLFAAKLAAKAGAHYVMLSTRRVYASSPILRRIDENETPAPDTPYGRNKIESEKRVLDLLGDKCSIMRISNVFGYEPGRSGFFGIAVTSLRREQRVILDVSPFVVRDFIPVEALCEVLTAVITAKPSGIFNVGSGIGVPIGKIALWLIQGYGSGELVVTCPDERDAFIVNTDKIKRAVQSYPS
ncbi:MAG: sugar nucleotide-binding protein, partial [Kiritimatiellae bacterium]|nr:sugar nucleotide-binding protein [Kiritimatiellia bacterium]